MVIKKYIETLSLFLFVIAMMPNLSFSLTIDEDNSIKNFEIEPVNRFANRKDPFLAGLLSTVMPGVGQIYAEDYSKGSLIIVGDFLGKAAIVSIIIALTNKYADNSSDSLGWEELNGGDKALILSVSILYLGFYIWNAVDAVNSAEEYNLKNFKEPSLNLSLASSKDYFAIKFQTSF